MTDNEIIKALECCCDDGCPDNCPLKDAGYVGDCIAIKSKSALDLINRQKADLEKNKNIIRLADKTISTQEAELDKKDTEIDILIRKKECLRDEISGLKAEIERLKEPKSASAIHTLAESAIEAENRLPKFIQDIKAEAVKEFAERLKGRHSCFLDINSQVIDYVEIEDIDNLLNEMVGEGK